MVQGLRHSGFSYTHFPPSIFCADGLRSRYSRRLIRQFNVIAPPKLCLAMLHLSRRLGSPRRPPAHSAEKVLTAI